MTVAYLPTTFEPEAPPGTVDSMTLCRAAGITYRQCDHWTRCGYLQDIPRPPDSGSGTPRYFPTHQVPLARLVKQLLDAGMQPRQAFELARDLLEHGHAHLAGIRIDLPTEP